jgi:hypothetical protein
MYLNDDDGLLDDVVDFVFDQIQQGSNATLSRRRNLDAAATNGANRFAHKIHINFIRISWEKLTE